MRTALLASAILLGLAAPSFAQQSGMTPGSQGGQDYSDQGLGFGPLTGHQGEQISGILNAARPFANGTFMRVKRGPDDEITLHCPPRLQLGTCVAGATKLMTNLNSITQGGSNQQQSSNDQQQQ